MHPAPACPCWWCWHCCWHCCLWPLPPVRTPPRTARPCWQRRWRWRQWRRRRGGSTPWQGRCPPRHRAPVLLPGRRGRLQPGQHARGRGRRCCCCCCCCCCQSQSQSQPCGGCRPWHWRWAPARRCHRCRHCPARTARQQPPAAQQLQRTGAALPAALAGQSRAAWRELWLWPGQGQGCCCCCCCARRPPPWQPACVGQQRPAGRRCCWRGQSACAWHPRGLAGRGRRRAGWQQ